MITPAGIWIQGHADPKHKPEMDACMSAYPGQMIYTGNTNRDKWLELGAPGQWITTASGGLIWHCDLGDFWQLYYALRQDEKPVERKRKDEEGYETVHDELSVLHGEGMVTCDE